MYVSSYSRDGSTVSWGYTAGVIGASGGAEKSAIKRTHYDLTLKIMILTYAQDLDCRGIQLRGFKIHEHLHH